MKKTYLSKFRISDGFSQQYRCGFTLMELLLVMAIMAVLTTMSLALIRKTTEDANVSATQARIQKIESILQTELERFETRKLPISKAVIENYVTQNPSGRNIPTAVQARNLRQRIMMDILNCEWPQANLAMNAQGEIAYTQRNNLGSFPSQDDPSSGRTGSFVAWLNQNYPNPQPLALQLQMQHLRTGAMQSWSTFAASQQNISGEYLYEILRQIDYDGMPAIETFGNAIVDSDDDGYPEIVDAFGEPMAMILVQVGANQVQPEVFEDQTVEWTKFQDAMSIVPIRTELLNSASAPREMQHIRVKVISARIGVQNGWLK